MNDYCQLDGDGIVVGVFHTSTDYVPEGFVISSGCDSAWIGTKRWDGNAFHDYEAPVRIITRFAFARRFTNEEFAAILTATKTDIAIEAYWIKAQMAEEVDLDDPDCSTGLDLLISKGLLTEERKAQILA